MKNNQFGNLDFQTVKDIKKDLRQRILSERRKLSDDTIVDYSNQIINALLKWDIYNNANQIMLYTPMPGEPQITAVFEHAWTNAKQVSVPHLRDTWGVMDAAVIDGFQDLIPGKFKNLLIPNPQKLWIVNPAIIELIVIPGIAFDEYGYRLGMGAGYYDRFLPTATKAITVGLCWSKNVLQSVPKEPHDLSVRYLITEKGIFNCKKGKM
ncbi:putative protein YqgN [bioreactor metagenome]|uniref:5-formyltetrahydrofolate cyclo-ligase n=1 Tax=bioreactor metagenome TaxID=1076179 RepID=A0A644UYY4_9ZZZZ|nr:5-formyltetrahydrofolate cyclo-ligase [Negativicutes bacterium]